MRKGQRYKEKPKKIINFQGILLIIICVLLISGSFVLKTILYAQKESYYELKDSTKDDIALSMSTETEIVIETEAPTTSLVDKSSIKLVNRSHLIDSEYVPELKEILNGFEVSSECWGYLKTMLGACETAGKTPIICSAYRSYDEQKALFKDKVDEYLGDGYDAMDAYYEAQRSVAMPGASEHQLGLAVDIVDEDNQNLELYQEDTPTQVWLMNNSWKYGFILRYPEGTEKWTGVSYEPWHYRFVGVDAAKEIHEQGICLEQYLK